VEWTELEKLRLSWASFELFELLARHARGFGACRRRRPMGDVRHRNWYIVTRSLCVRVSNFT